MRIYYLASLTVLLGCTSPESTQSSSTVSPPPVVEAGPAPGPAPTPGVAGTVAATATVTATATLAATAEPPTASAPTPKRKLGYADFLNIAGLRAGATLGDVERAWGPATRDEQGIAYKNGPHVRVFSMPPFPETGLMFRFGEDATPWIAKHPGDALSIWGKSCKEAADMLDFVDKLTSYTTCKHVENGMALDVTIRCGKKVNEIVVVWVPFDTHGAGIPRPPDLCSHGAPPIDIH